MISRKEKTMDENGATSYASQSTNEGTKKLKKVVPSIQK